MSTPVKPFTRKGAAFGLANSGFDSALMSLEAPKSSRSVLIISHTVRNIQVGSSERNPGQDISRCHHCSPHERQASPSSSLRANNYHHNHAPSPPALSPPRPPLNTQTPLSPPIIQQNHPRSSATAAKTHPSATTPVLSAAPAPVPSQHPPPQPQRPSPPKNTTPSPTPTSTP